IAFLDQVEELQAAVGVFLGDRDHEAEIGFHHLLLRDARLALALLHHVDDAAELAERHAGRLGDLGDLDTDAVDRRSFIRGKGRPFLVEALDRLQPLLVEFVIDIAIEEVLARDLVALGEAQHLPAQRGEAPVEAVELVDEIFDLLL
ncbi:hypothetical protein QT22_00510, partial [Staphylococcus aureus]